MTAVDVLPGHWAQVFKASILVKSFALFLPADLVIELAHLLFDIRLDGRIHLVQSTVSPTK